MTTALEAGSMIRLDLDMTDKAFTENSSSFAAAMMARSTDSKPRVVDKVVNLAPRGAEGAGASPTDRVPATKHADFSSAIDLIHEAGEAIRISEERAEDLEMQLKGFMEQASEEVRRLNSEIVARETQLARSEEQLRASEARAHEAESWLARINDAVLAAFTPLLDRRATMSEDSDRAYEAPRD